MPAHKSASKVRSGEKGASYSANFLISVLIHCDTTCRTAKALYSGSTTCRMLRRSLLRSLMRCMNWNGEGMFKYGGKGWPVPRHEERTDRSDVTLSLVVFTFGDRAVEVLARRNKGV